MVTKDCPLVLRSQGSNEVPGLLPRRAEEGPGGGMREGQLRWPRCQSRTLLLLFIRSVVSDSVTPWTAAHQFSLSFTISRSLFKPMSIGSVMPSNHLILCHPLLLLPSIRALDFLIFTQGVTEGLRRWAEPGPYGTAGFLPYCKAGPLATLGFQSMKPFSMSAGPQPQWEGQRTTQEQQPPPTMETRGETLLTPQPEHGALPRSLVFLFSV